ncbi:MAG: GNAT family N-acetyltransferase [Rhizobiaceae bacterium]|nr:GNAT family N-acetyltransferase [Rhizobiaceae bacterium]
MEHQNPAIVRTTRLEMTTPPRALPSLQTKSKLAVMQAPQMPLAFYRFLYGEIGKSHYWYKRIHLSDNELAKIIHDKNISISILYCDGAPAGFAELDISNSPDYVELIYFGLCPDFIGRGLGKWFLGQTVNAAWQLNPNKLIVSTDTLDHTNALRNYQKLGFTPVSFKDQAMEDWLQTNLLES